MKKLLVLSLLIFASGYQSWAKDHRCGWCNSNLVDACNCNAEFYTCSYCRRTITIKEAEYITYDEVKILGVHWKHYHSYRCPYCRSISKINMETGGTDQQDAVKFEKGCEDIRQLKKDLPGAGCFIATACYGSSSADEVILLCRFRDNILMKNTVGRIIIKYYYRFSPFMADRIAANPKTRKIVRVVLRPIVKGISIFSI